MTTQDSKAESAFLKLKGERLLSGGYPIIPIKAGSKSPGLPGWQSLQANKKMLQRWVGNGYANGGVGILTRNFPAVDLDIRNEKACKGFITLVENRLGKTMIRYGNYPKCLLIYRTEKPFKKKQSGKYLDQHGNLAQVEVLGDGQQFVAYHIHPDTGQPYYYAGLEPVDQPIEDIPLITEQDAIKICQIFDSKAERMGWKRVGNGTQNKGVSVTPSKAVSGSDEDESPDYSLENMTAKAGVSLARAKEVLDAIQDWAVLHDDWIHVGMALHQEFDAAPEALALWDAWSLECGKYEDGECATRWASFDSEQSSRKLYSFLSLLKEYSERGGSAKDQQNLEEMIAAWDDYETLTTELIPAVAEKFLSSIDSKMICALIKKRIKEIKGVAPGVGDIRRLLIKEKQAIAKKKRELALNTGTGASEIPKKKGEGHSLDDPLPVSLFPDVVENEETGAVKLLGTIENLKAMCDGYGITLTYDVIRKTQNIHYPDSIGDTKGDLSNEADINRMISLMALNQIPYNNCLGFVASLMDKSEVNRVTDFFEANPWDGVDRLPELFNSVTVAPELEHYRDKAIRMWLVQCVAAADGGEHTPNPRALPKYESVLVFQSPQGRNKTSWFGHLFPEPIADCFLDGVHLDLASTDSIKRVASRWVCELGEIDSTFSKNAQSRMKAFLSHKEDDIRLPYAKASCLFKRRTSFCATVNEERFLLDPTGSRRFLPLQIQTLDTHHGLDMQQIWAQVWHYYLEGEQWWPDAELEKMLVGQHAAHDEIDEVEVGLLHVFKELAPPVTAENAQFYSFKEICDEIGVPYTRRITNRVGTIIREAGGNCLKHRSRGFYLIKRNTYSATDQDFGDVPTVPANQTLN